MENRWHWHDEYGPTEAVKQEGKSARTTDFDRGFEGEAIRLRYEVLISGASRALWKLASWDCPMWAKAHSSTH